MSKIDLDRMTREMLADESKHHGESAYEESSYHDDSENEDFDDFDDFDDFEDSVDLATGEEYRFLNRRSRSEEPEDDDGKAWWYIPCGIGCAIILLIAIFFVGCRDNWSPVQKQETGMEEPASTEGKDNVFGNDSVFYFFCLKNRTWCHKPTVFLKTTLCLETTLTILTTFQIRRNLLKIRKNLMLLLIHGNLLR